MIVIGQQKLDLSVNSLVLKAVEEPKSLGLVYEAVLALRPATANATIRARVYENVKSGKILRVAKGVYVAVDGPARMVIVQGDAWEVLKQLPSDSVSAIVTDPPFDLGVGKNARIGTTRPHKDQGRTYQLRDLDREWFVEAHRVIDKNHEWASIASRACGNCGGKVDRKSLQPASLKEAVTGECATCGVGPLAPQKVSRGGGACFILTPPKTAQTKPHIEAMLALAEACGFEYQFEFAVDYTHKGMGYWAPQRHWLVHMLTAGKRGGVPHDLSVTSCFTVKRVMGRASKKGDAGEKDEHEAEKPVELYDNLIRFATRPGDVVLDPFAGRARWARQAVKDGRHVVLIEADPHWVERVTTDWS